MNDKEKRVEIFEDTLKVIQESDQLMEWVSASMDGTLLYKEYVAYDDIHKFEEACKVTVSNKRSFAAAEAYHKAFPDDRIAVLNFASATTPGGGVKRGSSAQEEALCRCSTLYPVLDTEALKERFYDYHKSANNVLYSNACIFSPGITVIKTDTAEPTLKEDDEWFNVDVLTCAAPNLRPEPYNKMNPGTGKAASITQQGLLALLKKRTEHILNVAAMNGDEALILGAFGCGAFYNPPEVVARAFKESLDKFKYCFKYVEFAVYCKPTETINYDIFSRRFACFK